MALLALTSILASLTFVCYRFNLWPFSLVLAGSSLWRRSHAPEPLAQDVPSHKQTARNQKRTESNSKTHVSKEEFSNITRTNMIDEMPSTVSASLENGKGPAITSMLAGADDEANDIARMPPPPIPSRSSARPTVPSSSTLAVPSRGNSGPLPVRNPAQSASRLTATPNRTASLLPPPTASRAPTLAPRTAAAGTVATSLASNPRKKVVLAPGHSPLDWAALQKSSPNLSGVPYPQRVTLTQLAKMNGRKGQPAWSTFQGKVYNIGPYLPFHPGGEGELKRAAGKVGDKLFMEAHPWVNWEGMMGSCLVGFLVDEDEGQKGQGLDAID